MVNIKDLVCKVREYNGPALRVLGIDLGTTNSTVAEIRHDPNAIRYPDLTLDSLEIDQPMPDNKKYTSRLVPSAVAM
jgi:molecular chaperone DnaK (HSP70)